MAVQLVAAGSSCFLLVVVSREVTRVSAIFIGGDNACIVQSRTGTELCLLLLRPCGTPYTLLTSPRVHTL